MAGALLAGACLAGCAAGGADPEAPSGEETPHGYVEGAEETAEARYRLILAEGDGGEVRVLDLVTEEIHEVPGPRGVSAAGSDGRFAYLDGDDGIHVVDGGTWTVDHGDHHHHYRTRPAAVTAVPGHGLAAVVGDPALTAVSTTEGVELLDRDSLEEGGAERSGGFPPDRYGIAVPYARHVVATDGDVVEVYDRAGEPVARIDAECPDPATAAVSRSGAVFACSYGALLVTEEGGEFTGDRIPRPEGATPGVGGFAQRPGGTVLAMVAGEEGAWVLDTTERQWTLVPTEEPPVAVNVAGPEGPLLVLTTPGHLHAYDIHDGKETAVTELLVEPVEATATAPVIEVDPERAYVNDASAGAVYEIDYTDDLRVARTLPLDIAPEFMVETGW